MKLEFAFVEKTADGRFAVKRKEKPEYVGEITVREVFDDESTAEEYRDKLNESLLTPTGPMFAAETYEGIRYSCPNVAAAQAVVDDVRASFASKGKPKELPTEDFDGVEILAVGDWIEMNGKRMKFTEADIDEIVANQKALGDKIKPYFKLLAKNHNNTAATPAIGWLTNFRRVGGKLVTDIKKVPGKVAQLLRAGTYRRISAELFIKYVDPTTRKAYNNVVTAAGLIGAGLPAITTLNDVYKHLFGCDEQPNTTMPLDPFVDETGNEAVAAFAAAEWQDDPNPDEGGDNVKNEELQKFRDDVVAALGLKQGEDVAAAIAKLQEDSSEGAKARKALADYQNSQNEKAFNAVIEKAKENGKLAPADEPFVRKMFGSDPGEKVSFTDSSGKEVEGTALEAMEAYFERQPKRLHLGELGPDGRAGDQTGLGDVPEDVSRFAKENGLTIDTESAELDRKALALCEQNKDLSYEDALVRLTNTGRAVEPNNGGTLVRPMTD